MEAKKVYNGVIDWWKIVFCLIIVVMHVGEYYHGDTFLFVWGRYGVEFFFVVSGFFMAAHVMRMDENTGLKEIGKENVRFIWGKIKTVFPAFIIAWMMAFPMYIFRNGIDILHEQGMRKFIMKLVCAIPNIMLLDMSGIPNTNVLGISWYVSAMLVVMFVTYPLLRKWRRNYCYIAAPIIAVALSGFYGMTQEGYHGIDLWTGFMKYGLLRGFVSINLGCLSYVIMEYIKNSFDTMSKARKNTIRFAEPILYIACIAMMNYGTSTCVNIINIFFTIAVAITMSGQSIFMRLCNNSVSRTVGKLSLWIYFIQSPVRMFTLYMWPDASFSQAFVTIFFPSVIISVIIMIIYGAIHKRKKLKVNTI